ncbi:MAG: T9SS type A sorting domain-containing protein [candidate division KSB1 bacterium]|nr:T9SS type A sorting domain-containing protein [candidate division KSB1 bacterium]MDZ7345827.1 T9SS type A sorting domain-containing protein [candidate division KSB1 bacterium]
MKKFKEMSKVRILLFCFLPAAAVWPQSQWTVLPDNMPVPVVGAEAVSYENKIYLFGGFSDSLRAPTDLVQCFDPKAPAGQRWSIFGRMLEARGQFVAQLWNDHVLLVGGRSDKIGREKIAGVELFSLKDGKSQFLQAPEQLLRIGAAGVLYNDLLLILGGYYSPTGPVAPPYLMVFDLKENRIVRILDDFPGQLQYDQRAVLLNGKVVLFGGIRLGVSSRIYELDLATWRFERIHPDLIRPLAGFASVKTPSDTVYLIGGYNEKLRASRSVLVFHRTPNRISMSEAQAEINIPRREATAVYLDGSIYLFGGNNGFQVVQEVEQLALTSSSSVKERVEFADRWTLLHIYPNPFNNRTTIVFEIDRSAEVRLDVFASDGSRIDQLLNKFLPNGRHEIVWNAENVPSGIYFVRLTAGEQILTRKIICVK